MNSLVWIAALLMIPALSSAAEIGTYYSKHSPDTVTVTLQDNGEYSVGIETQNGQSTCSFYETMTEFNEGDLRFNEQGCQLQVQQYGTKPDTLSVTVIGCESYCGAGSNLHISKATRR